MVVRKAVKVVKEKKGFKKSLSEDRALKLAQLCDVFNAFYMLQINLKINYRNDSDDKLDWESDVHNPIAERAKEIRDYLVAQDWL